MGTQPTDLVPWSIAKRHRWAYPLTMLRAEQRRRAGGENSAEVVERLTAWLAEREADGTVVAYDARQGFHYVDARAGEDLVRRP